MQEGEPVEFTTATNENNKTQADRVTGPMGAFVQGSRPPPRDFSRGSGDFGGGNDGGFGGSSGGFGSSY